jgi:hypothetical protein
MRDQRLDKRFARRHSDFSTHWSGPLRVELVVSLVTGLGRLHFLAASTRWRALALKLKSC